MNGEELIQQFEDGTTPADTFHHADHVRLAFEYLCRYTVLEALEKFSAALKRFCRGAGEGAALSRDHYLGLPASDTRAHHPRRPCPDLGRIRRAQLRSAHLESGVLGTLYRQETLDSDLACHTFVLPDQAL